MADCHRGNERFLNRCVDGRISDHESGPLRFVNTVLFPVLARFQCKVLLWGLARFRLMVLFAAMARFGLTVLFFNVAR